MQICLVDEFRIERGQAAEIRQLLAASFPDWEFTRHRNYFKQLPPRRMLAMEGTRLVGQLGLEHRVVSTTTGPASIFGIIDLCVDPSTRRQGFARRLLQEVEKLGRRTGIEFLVLFAEDPRIYHQQGFIRAANPLRWMRIHEHETLGIAEQPLDELMVKPLTERTWPGGLVDLLGYQF
jgi:GNAT superfamily N-acetyltransferase